MQPSRTSLSVLAWPLGALLLLAALAAGAAAPPRKRAGAGPTGRPEPVRFNRDIRPILSDNCFFCHGPDKNRRQAGLRLDLRDAAVAKGALVPGRPEKSGLIRRINAAASTGLVMPPESAHKSLTAAQKALLTRWVAEGAPYEAHWAYLPPRRTAPPPVRNARWVRNPIDRFVLARLEAERVKPSPEADRRTLLRRVSLDLTGLPPAPDELRAFLADRRPDAYERAVDRLLASPRYGERMAVPWLDAVRYADTVGFHGDQNQNAWAYRDWVIDAFNRNLPFDRFTVAQVAGDLLPGATDADRTATCFNRLNMVTREGGAQPKEYLAKYAADRVRTVGVAWLGSTFACAECHDHKYDPITQRDFYSLAAFFADVKQWGVYADYGYTPNPDLRGYNNDSPFPPEITVESRYLKERIARQRRAMDALATTASKPDPAAFAAWHTAVGAFLTKHPDGWETPAPVATAAAAKNDDKATPPLATGADGRVVQTTGAAANLTLTVAPADAGTVAALRLEVLPDPAGANTIFRQGIGFGTVRLAAAVRRTGGGPDEPVAFRHAAADRYHPIHRNGFELIGVHQGWMLDETRKAEPQTAVFLPQAPVKLAPGDSLVLTLPDCPAAGVRASVSPLPPDDPARPSLAPTYLAAVKEDSPAAKRAYLMGTGADAVAFAQAKTLEADILTCRGGRTPVLVTEALKTPAVTRVLPRGNWQDESGPVVAPAVPHFLPGYKADPGRRLSRLDLARWLVAPENPLTARVFVNRLWRQFFGNGLSGQVEDLGAQGEWPTHPELLDWLAVEFRKSGWDVKHVVRLMVTSAVYRQSSDLRPELRERDPNNRLLASQNPRRLEAEFVRDDLLAVAGLLEASDVGGPPVHPYQPAGYYAALQFPDRDYVPEPDDRQYRRGVYMHRQRTFTHPMLANFDAPSREDAVCTRTAANTPQQALTLLNDPEFVEAARVLAAGLVASEAPASAKGDAARLDRLYERALCRAPRPAERASLLTFLARVRREYAARPEDAKKLVRVGAAPAPDTGTDPVELAAWTTVCRVVLNLHETITRY
jgi:hypothetical protein